MSGTNYLSICALKIVQTFIFFQEANCITWNECARFLRRKYKLLSENPYQETRCRLKKQPHPTTSESETISRSVKSHVPKEVRSPQEKCRLSVAASTSTSVIDSLLINPSQYQYKNKKRKNTPLFRCVEHPHQIDSLPIAERGRNGDVWVGELSEKWRSSIDFQWKKVDIEISLWFLEMLIRTQIRLVREKSHGKTR